MDESEEELICKGCNQPIDEAWCHCGEDVNAHKWITDHSFCPVGCVCGFAKSDDEEGDEFEF